MTDQPTTQEKRKHAPRDGRDPDTICELDCGHSEMRYNNLHSDPTGWHTWCYTCDRERTVTSARPWHGSQDVEGASRTDGQTQDPGASRNGAPGEPRAPSTTQEAEKALETLAEMKHDLAHGMSVQGYREGTMKRLLDEYDAALRSLRTQHTRIQQERDNLEGAWQYQRSLVDEVRTQAAKDREERERLKVALTQIVETRAEVEVGDDCAYCDSKQIARKALHDPSFLDLTPEDTRRAGHVTLEELGEP